MALVASYVYGRDANSGAAVKLRAWHNTVTDEYTLMQASDDAVTQPQPITVASLPLPAGAATETTLAALNTKIPASLATAGNQATGNTSLASLDTKTDGAPTNGAHANVASSATAVTLQAANSARLGWTVYNESTAVLYVKCGSAASATSYIIQIAAGGYWELPFRYKGIITGLWASVNGNARVVEFT